MPLAMLPRPDDSGQYFIRYKAQARRIDQLPTLINLTFLHLKLNLSKLSIYLIHLEIQDLSIRQSGKSKGKSILEY